MFYIGSKITLRSWTGGVPCKSVFAQPEVLVPWAPPSSKEKVLFGGPQEASSPPKNSSGACHPSHSPSSHGHRWTCTFANLYNGFLTLCSSFFYPAIFKDLYLFLQQWWKDRRGSEIRTLILLSAASNWTASHSLAPKSAPMSGFHELSPTWTNTERESIHASSTPIHRPITAGLSFGTCSTFGS